VDTFKIQIPSQNPNIRALGGVILQMGFIVRNLKIGELEFI